MTLPSGTRLGPYEIVSSLGAGGMGEVYQAKDTRLDRTVAIKLLHSHFSDNAELRERFDREARTISSLSHPHICALYDIGQQDGRLFLVLEYLEGETLGQCMTRGPMALDQALRYGIQIVDALDKAHRQGVVHRDLKPSNIMLTRSGAKLMDFGLAKLKTSSPAALVSEFSKLPTERLSLTVEGTILGTFKYMAPEQLEGKEADARTDIFAFGTALYEMVTGRKAFDGKTPASCIGAILLSDPPPVTALQPMAPPALERLIRMCLAKDPEARWQNAHDLMNELTWIAEGNSGATVGKERKATSRERLAWFLAAGLLLALLVVLPLALTRHAPAGAGAVRLSITPPEKVTLDGPLAISPDGRYVTFIGSPTDRRSLVWLRPVNSLVAQPLPGTTGAESLFWSADSRSIGFFAQGKLKKIEVPSGEPQTLCDAPEAYGGAWSRDGVILFTPTATDSLYRISAEGGKPSPATQLDKSRHSTHRWPFFLPDGRHFLYLARFINQDNHAIYLGSLDSNETQRLLSAESMAAYAPPGYLLFIRGGNLLAQLFDLEHSRLTGEPVTVAEQVAYRPGRGYGSFSVSDNGTLAYELGGRRDTRLAWFSRSGKELKTISPLGNYRCPELSPDEKIVAVERRDPKTGNYEIALIRSSDARMSQFTFGPSDDSNAAWSPDGRQILFSSSKKGHKDIYRKNATTVGGDELLLESAEHKNVDQWSRDGRYIVYVSAGPASKNDLWVLPLFGKRKPFLLAQTPSNDVQGQISPDGKWLAYASDESGNYEVYVQRFPVPAAKQQISNNRGAQPRWRRDGRELFYVAADRRLMAVEVEGSGTFKAGIPKALFETRISGLSNARNHYAVTADGQRFLVNNLVDEPVSSSITVVLNWAAELKRP